MWYAPILIGLAGSLHCVAMCGALANIIPASDRHGWWKRLAYNGGRIFTYGVLGMCVSFIGSLALLGDLQSWVSFSMGIFLVLIGVVGIRINPPSVLVRPLASASAFLKKKFASLMVVRGAHGTFAMGMINGLLPCGMTWVALGYCIALPHAVDGFFAMLLFGAGTLPAMFGFSALLGAFTQRFRISARKLQTALLIISGCLLIGRTFTVAPTFEKDNDGIVICRTQ